MKVLIVNDDGIDSPSLKALATAVAAKGHSVSVVAPHIQYSGASHAFSLFAGLRVVKEEIWSGIKAYALTGTPADCVKFGIDVIGLDNGFTFDCVLSGINDVPNIATDVMYSGTVGAAMEAVVYGLPSIAISATPDAENFEYPADFVANNLTALLSACKGCALSVNFPSSKRERIIGVKAAVQGDIRYTDRYVRRTENGETVYYLKGEPIPIDNAPDSDVVLMQQGYVVVTPLRLENTAFERMAATEAAVSKLWL